MNGGFDTLYADWPVALDANDGSYARAWSSAPGQYFYVFMDNPAAGVLDGATINSIIIHAYAKIILTGSTTTSGLISLGYKTGTATISETYIIPNRTPGDYDLIESITFTTDSDGVALATIDIENLELYVRRATGSGFLQLRVTELWVEVGYTTPPTP